MRTSSNTFGIEGLGIFRYSQPFNISTSYRDESQPQGLFSRVLVSKVLNEERGKG